MSQQTPPQIIPNMFAKKPLTVAHDIKTSQQKPPQIISNKYINKSLTVAHNIKDFSNTVRLIFTTNK